MSDSSYGSGARQQAEFVFPWWRKRRVGMYCSMEVLEGVLARGDGYMSTKQVSIRVRRETCVAKNFVRSGLLEAWDHGWVRRTLIVVSREHRGTSWRMWELTVSGAAELERLRRSGDADAVECRSDVAVARMERTLRSQEADGNG